VEPDYSKWQGRKTQVVKEKSDHTQLCSLLHGKTGVDYKVSESRGKNRPPSWKKKKDLGKEEEHVGVHGRATKARSGCRDTHDDLNQVKSSKTVSHLVGIN